MASPTMQPNKIFLRAFFFCFWLNKTSPDYVINLPPVTLISVSTRCAPPWDEQTILVLCFKKLIF